MQLLRTWFCIPRTVQPEEEMGVTYIDAQKQLILYPSCILAVEIGSDFERKATNRKQSPHRPLPHTRHVTSELGFLLYFLNLFVFV